MALPKELEDNIKSLIKLFGDNNPDVEAMLLKEAEEKYNKIIPTIFNKQINKIKDIAKSEGELNYSRIINELNYLYNIEPTLKIIPSNNDKVCLTLNNKYLCINTWCGSYWSKDDNTKEYYRKEILRKIDTHKQQNNTDTTFDAIAQYITMSVMAGEEK